MIIHTVVHHARQHELHWLLGYKSTILCLLKGVYENAWYFVTGFVFRFTLCILYTCFPSRHGIDIVSNTCVTTLTVVKLFLVKQNLTGKHWHKKITHTATPFHALSLLTVSIMVHTKILKPIYGFIY